MIFDGGISLVERLKYNPNKHIPPSNIIYLIVLLKFNFWVACQPTIMGRLKESMGHRIGGNLLEEKEKVSGIGISLQSKGYND